MVERHPPEFDRLPANRWKHVHTDDCHLPSVGAVWRHSPGGGGTFALSKIASQQGVKMPPNGGVGKETAETRENSAVPNLRQLMLLVLSPDPTLVHYRVDSDAPVVEQLVRPEGALSPVPALDAAMETAQQLSVRLCIGVTAYPRSAQFPFSARCGLPPFSAASTYAA